MDLSKEMRQKSPFGINGLNTKLNRLQETRRDAEYWLKDDK